MAGEALSVYQAASQLGISVHTVRRWCKDFAGHLSDGANPETGQTRRLSPQDIAVLGEVSQLRSDGLSTTAINARLNETVFPAPIVEAPTIAQEGQGEVTGALVVVEAMRSIEARASAQEQNQRVLEERVRALESQRPTWRDVILLALSALIAGLIVGLSVWWFQ
jgi:DNA-binding transcriptional MerR regulator